MTSRRNEVAVVLASLPSPSQGVWHLGPIPIRAYALCIIAGILVALWLTQRRWKARGGDADDVVEVAMWACRSASSAAGSTT